MRPRHCGGDAAENDMPAVGHPCQTGHTRHGFRQPLQRSDRRSVAHRQDPELPAALLRLQADRNWDRRYGEPPPVGCEDVDAARPAAVDIARGVELHPVRRPLALPAGLRPHPATGQRAVPLHVEHADVLARGVVDEQSPAVQREAEPVGLVEHVPIDHQLGRTSPGRHSVDALEAQLPRPLDAVSLLVFAALLGAAFLPPRDAPTFAAPVRSGQVTLAWPEQRNATGYLLQITDGRRVLYERRLTAPYVDEIFALATDLRYRWRVFVLPRQSTASEPIARGTFVFRT